MMATANTGVGDAPGLRSVFLSYAREDDEPFVARLYADLARRGFDTWWDRERMPSRGATFLAEIRHAIDRCERFVLVLGPHAGTSAYVVAEWQHALAVGKPITPVLRLGDYESAPSELRLLHAEDARDDADYEACLDRLVRQLSEPVPPLGKLIGVPRLPRHLLARPTAVAALRDLVLADLLCPTTVGGARAVTSIAGMSGIGKSVLANLLARDLEARRAFPDGIIWVPVGPAPDLPALQRQVASASTEQPPPAATIAQGRAWLSKLLAGKRVLVVLDDVWERQHADAFDVLGPRGRVAITTQNAGLVSSIGGEQYQVQLPTESESLRLLARGADVAERDLPAVALKVARESGQLPLALALCGGMVRRGYTWSDVLGRLRDAALEHVGDRDAATPRHRSLWAAIEVSAAALAPDERQRYYELSVFVPGAGVPVSAVLALWGHTGAMGAYAREDLLHALVDRSLLQIEESFDGDGGRRGARVRLHDLLADLLNRVSPADAAAHRRLLAAFRAACPNGWSSGPDDGYFYQRLVHHLIHGDHVTDAVALLFDARWLEAKLRFVPVGGLAEDCRLLLAVQPSPLKGASREFVEFLRELVAPLERVDTLPTLLWGHFAGTRHRPIARLLRQIRERTDRAWLRPLSASLSLARTGPIRVIGQAGGIESLAIGDTADGETVIVKVGKGGTGNDWSRHRLGIWLGEARQRRVAIPDEQTVTALNLPGDHRPALLHTWRAVSGDTCCRLYDLTAAVDGVAAHIAALFDQPAAPPLPAIASYALGEVMCLGGGTPRYVGKLAGRLALLVSFPSVPPRLRRRSGESLIFLDLSRRAGDALSSEFMELSVDGMKAKALTPEYADRIARYAQTVSVALGEEIVVDPPVAVPCRAAVWNVETGQQQPELVWSIDAPPDSRTREPVLLGESIDGSPFIVVTTSEREASLQRLGGRETELSWMTCAHRPILSRYRGRPAILKGGPRGIDVVDASSGRGVGHFDGHLDDEKLLASIDREGRASLVASVGSLGSRGRFSTSVRLWDADTQKQVFPTGDIHTEEIMAVTSGLYRGKPVFATGSWNLICVWRAERLRGYSSDDEPKDIPDPNLCGRIALEDLPRGYRHHDLGSVLPQMLLPGMVVGMSTRAAPRSDGDSLIASRQVWRLKAPDADGWRHGVVSEARDSGRGSDVVAVSMKGEGERWAVIETTRRDGTRREWVLMPRADEERQFANWLYWHCVAIRGPLTTGVQIAVRVDPVSGDVEIAYERSGMWEKLAFDPGVPATQCALGEKGDSIVIFDERGNSHHLALEIPDADGTGCHPLDGVSRRAW